MKQTELWIGGQWVAAKRSVTLVNPHTGESLAEVGYASPEQVSVAIETAAKAFRSFRSVPAYQRATILSKVADILQQRREEAARCIALEAAKPITAARAEMDRTIQTYQFAAEAAKSLYGEYIPMDAAPRGTGHIAYTKKVPLGVVSAITPFNFPFNLVAHKVGPAIAAGNTVVLKPAEQTPLSALFLADVFEAAGLPEGVLNIVPGAGHELGEVLTSHPCVAYVTFTGSPRVGKLLKAQAGLRRVTLELGSNSPLLIDDTFSPGQLNQIAAETVSGGFAYNGQVCISVQRVYVQRNVYPAFLEMVVAKARTLKIGDPLRDDTDISALINTGAAERLRAWLQNALAKGAQVATGGAFQGNVMEPTVLTHVPNDVEFNCEEAFGPVMTVTPFDTWDEAIAMANDSKYGLHAGVFTLNIERAMEAADRLETGGVLVNQVPTFRVDQLPYGGVKESGTGREGVRYATDEMMDMKLVGIRTGVFRN